jgi:hypothetical protein
MFLTVGLPSNKLLIILDLGDWRKIVVGGASNGGQFLES